jgi:hypothetical protein
MPDAVFTYRMPAGIPGEVSRFTVLGTTIEAEPQNATTPVNAYGQLCVVDTNGCRPIAAADSAAIAVGLLGISVRPFPGSDLTVGNVPFGAATPPTKGVIDILKRGYITVKNNVGSPVKGGAVFVYFGTSTGSHVQAGFEAAAGANLWQVPGAYFMGAADANGNVEIQFNL